MSVLHGYRDIKPLIFLDHDLDLLGSRDFLYVVNCSHTSDWHGYGDIKPHAFDTSSGSPLMVAHSHIKLPIVLLKKLFFFCMAQGSYVPNLVKIGP